MSEKLTFREKLRCIKQQLMFNYEQGAQLGKELKQSHKDRIDNLKKKER